jgi:Trk K+ transport system NAD-binding subunit
MQQHFILCGLGKVGARVLEYLRAAGSAVVVVDDRCAADDPRLGGVPLVSGDCRQPDVLLQAGLHQARGVLILTSDDLVSFSTALAARQLHPTIRVVVRLFNQSLISRLGAAVGNMQALSTSALAAPLLALIARTGEALGTVRLGEGRRQQIAEIAVADGSPLIGQRVADLARQHQVAVVAHHPAGQPWRFIRQVDADATLGAEDKLVLCGPSEQVTSLSASGDNESIPVLLWAGIAKRFGRVLARGLSMIDWPVKICTLVFLSVIVSGVLVFHFGMKNDTLIDAFYRTISLMATGADMHGDEVEPGSWQKLFISSLKLFGLAITAAFTAIFTNYLIRANLKGAMEIRRIPESGHIIVCGLGNVSFRAVEELLHEREPVVAIERNPDNAFIPTARRLGVAVVVGDALVPEVLRQAHAASARAVIAATDNELVNLEIGLLVRELAPKQRVVLRLIDAELARILRQAAHIRFAVSIPELAAPAFVAALYGDRVRNIFQVAGRSFAVYELILQPGDALLEEPSLAQWSRDFNALPLLRTAADGTDKPLQETSAPGDRLTIIVSLDHLQRLVARELATAPAVLAPL